MTSASASLPQFDGNRIHFIDFLQEVYQQAANASTIANLMQAHIMTADEVLARFGQDIPTIPPPPPVKPILPPIGPNGGMPDGKIMQYYQAQMTEYENCLKQYNTWNQEKNIFQTRILSALNINVKNTLSTTPLPASPNSLPPMSGGPPALLRERTLQQLMALLRATYDNLTVKDITSIHDKMKQHFNPSSMDITRFIDIHRDAHRVLEANKNIIPTNMKVSILKECLTPCGMYQECFTIYTATHPTPALQDFESFVTAIRLHEPIEASTMNLGYANQVTNNQHLSSSKNKDIEDFLRDEGRHFCHTHGLGKHTSANCEKQGPGHNTRSTYSNRNGSKANASINYRKGGIGKKNT